MSGNERMAGRILELEKLYDAVQDDDIDFSSRLFTEYFDRTPEGRTKLAHITSSVMTDVSIDDSTTEINRRSFEQFATEVDGLVDGRKKALIGDAVSVREHPPVDARAEGLRARMQITAELAELNQALPFPNLDRLDKDEGDPKEITLPDELLSSIELQFDRRAEFSERRSTIELGILARQFGWTAIVRVFDEIAEKDWAEGADA